MTLLELYKEQHGDDTKQVVAAYVNGKLRELRVEVEPEDKVEFIPYFSSIGYDFYKRSIILLLMKAARDVIGKEDGEYKINVMYSMRHGFFCQLESDDISLTDELLDGFKKRMKELADADITIEKTVCNTSDMREDFKRRALTGKASLLKFRKSSKINIYSLDGYRDYYYGYMVPSTGYLKEFDLVRYDDGFVVVIPEKSTGKLPTEYTFPNKLYQTLRQSEDWGRKLNANYVGDINNAIVNGGVNNMILVQEALMEKQIGDIAKEIIDGDKKLVLIAGPSSSGKTTFSNRLSIQLMTYGVHPHPIAMDNFFKERSETPVDENGDYDFECLEALDLDLLENTMEKLLNGEEVQMPTFDFTVGKKVFDGTTLKLGSDDVIVMEGIHALNPEATKTLSKDSCYKIYISALTQLNIDEHNRISTTDTRLLRRIVRDARTRGHSATKTIKMWPSVRRGEEKYIFPFQEEADAMFNSALLYELSAIKTFAEPLLYGVPEDSEEFFEAKRLLKFLGYFLGIDVQSVPQNSLMREFIGGGCFKV